MQCSDSRLIDQWALRTASVQLQPLRAARLVRGYAEREIDPASVSRAGRLLTITHLGCGTMRCSDSRLRAWLTNGR